MLLEREALTVSVASHLAKRIADLLLIRARFLNELSVNTSFVII